MLKMERLPNAPVTSAVALGVLVAAAWLFLRQHQASPATAIVSRPAAPVAPSSDIAAKDNCRQAVVLTLQSHSGVSARMTAQNAEGQEIPTESASDDEGRFTVACYRLENDDRIGDASPQFLKICNAETFVLHITGSGKGVFDLQAKAFPEVAHQGDPLLLCNYRLENDRIYDWVLKYHDGSRPAVFLLGSKNDPNLKP